MKHGPEIVTILITVTTSFVLKSQLINTDHLAISDRSHIQFFLLEDLNFHVANIYIHSNTSFVYNSRLY